MKIKDLKKGDRLIFESGYVVEEGEFVCISDIVDPVTIKIQIYIVKDKLGWNSHASMFLNVDYFGNLVYYGIKQVIRDTEK